MLQSMGSQSPTGLSYLNRDRPSKRRVSSEVAPAGYNWYCRRGEPTKSSGILKARRGAPRTRSQRG